MQRLLKAPSLETVVLIPRRFCSIISRFGSYPLPLRQFKFVSEWVLSNFQLFEITYDRIPTLAESVTIPCFMMTLLFNSVVVHSPRPRVPLPSFVRVAERRMMESLVRLNGQPNKTVVDINPKTNSGVALVLHVAPRYRVVVLQ